MMRSTIWTLVLLGCIVLMAVGNRTIAVVHQNSLLSRRVRGLIFPPKAAVLLTAALTKIIVGGRPSGLQYSLEFDMYVPLPDTIDGWRPKILQNLRPKKPAAVIKPKQRVDWNRYAYDYNITNYNYPYRRDDMTYYGSTAPYYKYANPKSHKDYFYKSPWQLTEEPVQRHRQSNIDEESYESWTHVPRWKLNRGYRERREIFDQFEAMGKFFQIDLRSCIKRAMCELQANFNKNHQNNFLMEDLFRIILTVPENIDDDKYQRQVEFKNCAQLYAVSCPYKILDFILQNVRNSKSK